MGGLDGFGFWRHPDFGAGFGWYRDVAANRKPAKYLIARSIGLDAPLDAPEDVLWRELERRTAEFLAFWTAIRNDRAGLPPAVKPNLLDLCRELGYRMLAHCNFCRWDCRVDRAAETKLGACKLGSGTRVSSYFHHPGEELIYRGRAGSGTIFFTSCNMRCAFCQNGDISTDKDNGAPVSPRTLATMAWILRVEGCHNINWVGGDPTIHLHTIVDAIAQLPELAPGEGDLRAALPTKADWRSAFPAARTNADFHGAFNAPMLWNSNFFMSREAMALLRLLMDIWLPDFKFGPGECAKELSRTPWYWETVTENLRLIHCWGEEFTIRHLVMPEHVECCTKPVLEWVAREMPEVPVNVMDQYRPENFCDPEDPKFKDRYRPIARRPRRGEIEQAYRYARELGLRFQSLSLEKDRSGLRF
ncbi:MAG TPA: radical SAM protein [Burkholderiales bacterium]|nr:radical SAM protein [Burkholderiales bacterium]